MTSLKCHSCTNKLLVHVAADVSVGSLGAANRLQHHAGNWGCPGQCLLAFFLAAMAAGGKTPAAEAKRAVDLIFTPPQGEMRVEQLPPASGHLSQDAVIQPFGQDFVAMIFIRQGVAQLMFREQRLRSVLPKDVVCSAALCGGMSSCKPKLVLSQICSCPP